jgi:Ca2+-binding RTX toxin-like protein
MPGLTAAVVIGLALVVALADPAPERAAAAPCPIPSYGIAQGTVTIAGNSPCDSAPERFVVFCGGANKIYFSYFANEVLQDTFDTTIDCAAATSIRIFGNGDDDRLDLSATAATAGFTALTGPNVIDGGAGNDVLIGSPVADSAYGGIGTDTLRVRDGGADAADCGADADSVVADRLSVDTLTNCETVDALPEPPAQPSPPTSTDRPTLSGKAKVGKVLTCSPGTWTGSPTFAYSWLRNGDPIAGEVNTTLTLARQDAGRAIQCEVTATNADGAVTADSKPVAPKKRRHRHR